MKFELSKTQLENLRNWTEGQSKKSKTKDAIGFRYSFTFSPTSIGMTVKVVDHVTKEELDLTEDF